MDWLLENAGRFLRRLPVVALAFAVLTVPALASNVQFVGSVGWSSDHATFAILTADQIHNSDANGTSAALRVEFWASPQPFAGSFTSNYRLSTYDVGPLAAGSSTARIVAVVPLIPPPAGTWRVAMVLTEFTGASTNDGYAVRNYLDFPDPFFSAGPSDAIPPTVSITSPTGGNVSGTVTIFANASDNVGVSRVDFYANGSLLGSDSAAPFQFSWNTAAVANGAATLFAKAYDAAGNSAQSATVSVNVANVVAPPPDTTPPSVSIVSPTGGNVSGTVAITANASDNVGVTRVDLLVNGVTVASDTSAPYQFSWNSTSVANGAAQLKAVAYDAAGNLAQSAIVTVTVANVVTPPSDTTPPSVSIASPTGGNVSGTVAITANASDNVGVTRVDLLVNGVTVASDTSAPYQFSWNSTSVANGAAQLKAVAYDAAGNLAQSAIVAVTVANVVAPPPNPAPPPGPPVATSYAIEYYHAAFDHYFISASASDINALDSGKFNGWARTGNAFKVYAQPTGSANPVCRFYIPPVLGDSHFYSASPAECADAVVRFPLFVLESENVFYVNLPDAVTGACPANMVPVYRVWNTRRDSNHRYMTDRSLRDLMVAKGYVAEGYGQDAVIMCAPM